MVTQVPHADGEDRALGLLYDLEEGIPLGDAVGRHIAGEGEEQAGERDEGEDEWDGDEDEPSD